MEDCVWDGRGRPGLQGHGAQARRPFVFRLVIYDTNIFISSRAVSAGMSHTDRVADMIKEKHCSNASIGPFASEISSRCANYCIMVHARCKKDGCV